MNIIEELIEDGFLVRKFDNGTIVKTPERQETEGKIIELPKNPLLELQKENESLVQTVAKLNIENKKKDEMANTMAKTIADLNLRLSKLEKEGK